MGVFVFWMSRYIVDVFGCFWKELRKTFDHFLSYRTDSMDLGPFNVFILLTGQIYLHWCVRLSQL